MWLSKCPEVFICMNCSFNCTSFTVNGCSTWMNLLSTTPCELWSKISRTAQDTFAFPHAHKHTLGANNRPPHTHSDKNKWPIRSTFSELDAKRDRSQEREYAFKLWLKSFETASAVFGITSQVIAAKCVNIYL